MIVVYTEDNQYGSLYHMGEYITNALNDLGLDATLVTTTSEIFANNNVLNLQPNKILPLLKSKRFLHFNELVTVFTTNPDEYLYGEMSGMLACLTDSKIVAHSPQLFRQLQATLASTFSPHFRRSYSDNLKRIQYGVGPEFQDRLRNDKQRWLCPYNRLNETQKNFRVHVEAMIQFKRLMNKLGTPIENDVVLMDHKRSNRERYAGALTEYNVITQQPDRSKYPDLLNNYGGFLCTSHTESFGIYYLELLASGAVGVFLDKPWVRDLLPEYPYIVKKDELANACGYVVGNYEIAKKRAMDYWNSRRADFDIQKFSEHVANLFNNT